jgi:hypothetical protein
MRKSFALALAVATIAGPAGAAPRHWYSDKKWWIGEAVNIGATMADANSTCRALRRGAVEENMVLGARPSCGQAYALEVGAAGYWTFFHALNWHWWDGQNPDPKLGWRLYGYASIPVAVFAINGSAAIHNYGVSYPAPPNTTIGTAVRLRQEDIRAEFNSRMGQGFAQAP